MSSTSVLLLLSAASAVSAAFFEAGACSTESITKTRQPLIQNPAVGASRICFDFDLSRDDASKRLQEAGISESAPHLANASQCEALLNAAADDAFACIQGALTGAGLENGAISAAIDIATAVGCTEFKAKTLLVAALNRNDVSGAVRLLETDPFCSADACRCAQDRYCISPCDSRLADFSTACPVAPGSALCAGATTSAVDGVSDAATTTKAAVACNYSAWKRQSACSATCKAKSGYETWARTVNDLQACTGALSEERACKATGCDAPYGGGAATNAVVVNQNQNNQNGNGTALDDQTLGGIIGGSIAAVLLLGLCIFFIRRRNNSKDKNDVYNPEQQAPAVGNPLFNDNQQRGENPLFSEDSLQKLEVPAEAAPVAAAAVAANEAPETVLRKSRKASKKKVRDEAEKAVCITCGKEFKDSALLRMHATTHQAGNDNDGNETLLSDGDTFGRTESTLGDDKPLPLGYSEQGSVANLMVNDNL